MPSNHLVLSCPLLPPSVFPSIRVFSNESFIRIRWSKFWSFSFSISPSNGYSGLISFRMDWLALVAVQGTLKSLIQYHSSKASIIRHSAFFMIQLSHPYMTTRKAVVLTIWTFVGKLMSLLDQVCHNFLSKENVSFNFMVAVTVLSDFGAQEKKNVTASTCLPSICQKVMGLDVV